MYAVKTHMCGVVEVGMSVRLEGELEEATAASAALDALLRANEGTLVAAFGGDGTLVPLPASVPLHGRRVFPGCTGLDMIVADDHILVIDAWERAGQEPIVSTEVRLVADPEECSVVHFFDLRAEHGVHVIVLETQDPDLVMRSFEARSAERSAVAHVKRDGVGVFLEVDDATTALLGWSPADLLGQGTTDLVHPDDVERAIESWMALRAGIGSGRTKVRYRHARGHHVWLEVTSDNHLDDPERGYVLSELVDISDEMAHLEALHASERQLARLAEALPIGICHVRSDREVVYTNEPLRALFGVVDSIEGLVGRVARADRPLVERALESALHGRPGDLEVGVTQDLEERRCELTFRTMTSDGDGVDGVILCAADVTDRSRLRAELEHRATHDALSGCLNRVATVAALELALAAPHSVAVAFIDLDGLKEINDEFGHAAGDELLRAAASRLHEVIRGDDRIGRIGGDEFVVIAPQGRGPFDAMAVAGRLTEAINGDVWFGNQRLRLRASVGLTISLDGEIDAEAVLSRADAAMYEAKRRTRSLASPSAEPTTS
jgi:diguanylate cyclase (GGDEF)-like protein/PAS domain S-box-containing protein